MMLDVMSRVHFAAAAVLAIAACAALSLVPASAHAQERDVAAAAAAFQQAQQAQLRGDYTRAGELFELAFGAAESQAALRSAIRNYIAAEDLARAATLSLRALTRYPGEVETRQLAQETLGAHQAALGHVRVHCSAECVLLVDGTVEEALASDAHEFFVRPGTHSVSASFEGRPGDAQEVTATAGEVAALDFTAPPVVEDPVVEEPVIVAPRQPEPREPASGLSPIIFWSGAGLTLVLGGVAVWSLVDTLDARDAYEAAPTERGYNQGRSKERRLFAFTGAVATVGVATLLLGVLGTRWSSGEREHAQFDLQLGPDGGRLSVMGSF